MLSRSQIRIVGTITGLLFVGVLAAVIALRLVTPSTAPKTTAHFLGFTNGITGPLVRTFTAAIPNVTAAIPNGSNFVQQWLASGTNVALFSVTNYEGCAIDFLGICNWYTKSRGMDNELIPILNVRYIDGNLIQPGRVFLAEVPVVPHGEPWRVAFFYHRHHKLATLFWQKLKGLPDEVNGGSAMSEWQVGEPHQ